MSSDLYGEGRGYLNVLPSAAEIEKQRQLVLVEEGNLRRMFDMRKNYRENERKIGKFSTDVDQKIRTFMGIKVVFDIGDLKANVSPSNLSNHGGKTWTIKFSRIYNVCITQYNGKQIGIRRDMLK